MVLDAGRLVEFDSPRELLKKDGLLKSLVEESADNEVLYAMAEGQAS
jgi:ABC-type multidrug transport system fused ATPase/permease subunit